MVNLFQSICFKFYPGFPTRGNIFRKIIVARFGGGGKGKEMIISLGFKIYNKFLSSSTNSSSSFITILLQKVIPACFAIL